MDGGRLDRVRGALRRSAGDLLVVGPGADLRYLVGYDAPPLERATLLLVPADEEPVLLVPRLEVLRAEASGATDLVELAVWEETEDPFAAVDRLVAAPGSCAVEDRLWTMFTLRLQALWPACRFVAGSSVMRELRIEKSDDEIDALRRVGQAIDGVHAKVPQLLRPGRSEQEVGRDIAELILASHDEVSFVIVASGPNGASPHHDTGSRRLEHGDAVVVDIGGTLGGYCSDATRNYAVGQAPDGYRELHDVLAAAQRAAVDSVRPGVTAEAVDAAARDVIAAAGFGDLFVHRTGHGIGIEVHEEPYIVAGNREELRPGMAFSIEPGIYVPDRYGARIEDIVVVTPDGVERLNVHPRDLVVVEV